MSGMIENLTGTITFDSPHEMTKFDDVLNIYDATITLVIPGDLFTNEGNDTVTVTDSTLTGPAGTSFFLGSGNDTLDISASTLDVATVTGIGDDYVTISGDAQSSVVIAEGKTLSLCSRYPEDGQDGNDTLEVVATLEGAGNITFGEGDDTLIFNGGVLAVTGEIAGLENLAVSAEGGTLGCDLTLDGAVTSITYAGAFAGVDAARVISIAGSDTTFAAGEEVVTDVAFDIADGAFTQTDGGSFAISGNAGNAFTAANATVALHDFEFSGNDGNGIEAADSDLTLVSGSFTANKQRGLLLTGTGLIGEDLAFTGNNGAIKTDADVVIDRVEFSGNYAAAGQKGGAIDATGNIVVLADAVFEGNYAAGGGAIYAANAAVTIDGGNFTGNRAINPYYYYGGAIWAETATINLTDVEFVGNYAKGMGGAIYLSKGSTLNYTLNADNSIAIVGNYSYGNKKEIQTAGAGGFLYLATAEDAAIFDIGENAVLTIGGDDNNDSIDGLGAIAKNGEGELVINSSIGADLTWTITAGTLELARIARNIDLANFAIGADATLRLSENDDILALNGDVTIDGILDLGGATAGDAIDTNGYTLAGGTLLISALTLSGDGAVSSELATRDPEEGFELTLDGITLESGITGGEVVDTIEITKTSALNGAINLGGGDDAITIAAAPVPPIGEEEEEVETAFADFAAEVNTGWGDDTITIGEATVFRSGLHMDGRVQIFDIDSNPVGYLTTIPFMGNISLDADGQPTTPTTDNNTLTVNAETSFMGEVWMGFGDDVLAINAETVFEGEVEMMSGNDLISIAAATAFNGKVLLGDGDDAVVISAAGTTFADGIDAGSGDDSIAVDADATIAGEIALGDGQNRLDIAEGVTVGAPLDFKVAAGSTWVIAHKASAITDNTVTVYADAEAGRTAYDLDWTDKEGIDKVRIGVAQPDTDAEFAIALYNESKTLTLNVEDGFTVTFMGQNEDGWKEFELPTYTPIATGRPGPITAELSGEVAFSDEAYEMSAEDDTLTITDATVTMTLAGDMFTNEGNDTVTITNSTLTAEPELALFLGSGDDNLTISASALNADVVTGVGSDYVIVAAGEEAGGSVTIAEGNTLYLTSRTPQGEADGDDTLVLTGTLEGAGGIAFGDGDDTLIFDGGVLAVTGEITGLENLAVSIEGGTLGCDLTLGGAATSVTYAGAFAGVDAARVISIAESDTAFATDGEITTDVAFDFADGTFTHADGGSFAISGNAGNAFTAANATVTLHDIDFSDNGGNGIEAADSGLAITGGSFTANKQKGLLLTGTGLIARDLAFTGNNGAIKADGDVVIYTVEFSGNYAAAGQKGGAIDATGNIVVLTDAVFEGNYAAGGGAIYAADADVTIDGGNFTSNQAINPYYYHGGAIWAEAATLYLTDVEFVGNIAKGMGGAIYLGGGSILEYTLTAQAPDQEEPHSIVIVGNYSSKSTTGAGGFLYLATENDTAVFNIEENAVLTIGGTDETDSIDGLGAIVKNGEGELVINSIVGADLTWTITAGTLELGHIKPDIKPLEFAQEIDLANFTIGAGATLRLSQQNDKITLNSDVTVNGILDLGGAVEGDAIDTNGYTLSGGSLLISALALTGNGTVASEIATRDPEAGFALTLAGITLDSSITGGEAVDTIDIVKASTLNGAIDLGGGDDAITIKAQAPIPTAETEEADAEAAFADFAAEVNTGWGDDTITIGEATVFQSDLYMGGRTIPIDDDTPAVTDNNTLTVNAETTFVGKVSLGSGDDVLAINAETAFEGEVNTRSGNDLISIAAATAFNSEVLLGYGDDTITIGADAATVFAGAIDLGDGANTIIAAADVDIQQGIAGEAGNDIVTFNGTAAIAGAIDLAGGYNVITANATLTLADGAYVQMTDGGTTVISVSRGAALAENTITACFDATSTDLAAFTFDWSDAADLDKARLVVSSDSNFSEFEFAVELFNGITSFTIITENTNYIQLQAQDEDGWKPRFVDATKNDLNGDGRADIVMSIVESGHEAEGATGAWLIQADQTAAWGDLSTLDAGWEVFGTGFTAIDKTTSDVYLKSTGNVVGAWTTDDTGAVTGWETIGEFDTETDVLGIGDFNGDSQSDLLLRNVNGAVGCYFTSGDVTGWNYFQSLGDEWTVSAIGDLNGDGRDDLVLKNDAGFAGSWLTQADYTMEWANLDTLPEGMTIIGTGDFNGDGTDDVLLRTGTYVGAWIVQDGSVTEWMGLGDLGDVTIEQIADFDADGIDDLRIRTAAGDLGAQLVKGEDNLEWKYYGSVGDEWKTSLASI